MAQRFRILLVEDSLEESLLMQALVEREGLGEVLAVQDGLAGAERVQDGSFHLVICDLNLPGCDGIGVVRASKRAHPDRPIMVTTGYHDPELHSRARVGGADVVLTKPLDRDSFLEALRSLLERVKLDAPEGDPERDAAPDHVSQVQATPPAASPPVEVRPDDSVTGSEVGTATTETPSPEPADSAEGDPPDPMDGAAIRDLVMDDPDVPSVMDLDELRLVAPTPADVVEPFNSSDPPESESEPPVPTPTDAVEPPAAVDATVEAAEDPHDAALPERRPTPEANGYDLEVADEGGAQETHPEIAVAARAAGEVPPKTVLAVGAYPGDVIGGCGGILSGHARDGWNVVILSLTRRFGSLPDLSSAAHQAARRLNARLVLGDVEAESEERAVDLVRSLVDLYEPATVLTPSAHDRDAARIQAHDAVVEATPSTCHVYAYHTPSTADGFRPNLFASVERLLDLKTRALEPFAEYAELDHLSQERVERAARLWARGRRHEVVEPLELIWSPTPAVATDADSSSEDGRRRSRPDALRSTAPAEAPVVRPVEAPVVRPVEPPVVPPVEPPVAASAEPSAGASTEPFVEAPVEVSADNEVDTAEPPSARSEVDPQSFAAESDEAVVSSESPGSFCKEPVWETLEFE